MNQIYLTDFFLVWPASLFKLRTFSAQINWRGISRKILFDSHRFLSNKLPINFAVTSRKGNKTFLSKTACSNWLGLGLKVLDRPA